MLPTSILCVSQNISDFTASINTKDKLWDFNGLYVFLTMSAATDLAPLAESYKMQKTVDSYILQ